MNTTSRLPLGRKDLTRLVLIALAFTAVCVSLSTRPAGILDYWFLFYSPVVISAISFGLRGALVGSGLAIGAIAVLLNRFQELILLAAGDMVLSTALLSFLPHPGFDQTLQ